MFLFCIKFMVEYIYSASRYKIIIIIDECMIGNLACSYFNRIEWPNLFKISLSIAISHLGKNRICDEGCIHLSKAEWRNLNEINLCIFESLYSEESWNML